MVVGVMAIRRLRRRIGTGSFGPTLSAALSADRHDPTSQDAAVEGDHTNDLAG